MSVPWIPIITRLTDGQDVSAATLNPVFSQLSQRDQFLYDSLASVNSKSSLVLLNQAVLNTGEIQRGSVVCMTQDQGGNYGLELAQTAFDFSDIRRTYAPSATSYVLGIVYEIPATGTANVLTSGLLELPDASVLVETGETPVSGAYYLSTREAGKITASPGGLAIYVGYMLPPVNSVFTQFYVTININELSQFLTTYRFELLDRPAGTATLADGTWTIVNDTTKVGWIAATGLTGAPTGASFKYNIPGDVTIDDDTALTEIEKEMAKRLGRALPPNPTHFNILTVNGVIQRQVTVRDLVDTEGAYVVNTFGIWWMSNVNTEQPWPSIGTKVCASSWNWDSTSSSSSSSSGDDCAWSIQAEEFDYLRPKLALWVSRLNPALVDTIVTSIAPKTSTTPLRLTSTTTPLVDATVGNLYIDLPIVNAGETPGDTTAVTGLAGGAGNTLQVTNTNVVRQLVAGAGIALQPTTGVGAVTVSATNISNSGEVTSLEPENSRFLYTGLHSYLLLTNPAVRADGFVGKLVLPTSISTGILQLSVTLFGSAANSTGADKNVSFQYQYATSAVNSTIADTVTTATVTIVIPNGYTAKKALKFTPVELSIPAASIQPGAIVNFRLTRSVPTANAYTADIGILSVGWTV